MIQNYFVRLEKSVIICTSNYQSTDQIRKELGEAIFNRFDVVIGFSELSDEAKLKIAEKCIEETKEIYLREKKLDLDDLVITGLKNMLFNVIM